MKKLLCLLLALVMALSLIACGGNDSDKSRDDDDDDEEIVNEDDRDDEDEDEDEDEDNVAEGNEDPADDADVPEDTSEEETSEETTEGTTEQVVATEAPAGNDLVGTWSADVIITTEDMGLTGEDFAGLDTELVVTMIMEFSEDGIATMYVDEDAWAASLADLENDVIDFMVELMYAELESEGYSRAESDDLFVEAYGTTIYDFCADYVTSQNLSSMVDVSELRDSGDYSLDGSTLTVGVFTMTVEVTEDTLTVLNCDDPSYWEDIGFEFPVVLHRVG